jgi:hypothetical protein
LGETGLEQGTVYAIHTVDCANLQSKAPALPASCSFHEPVIGLVPPSLLAAPATSVRSRDATARRRGSGRAEKDAKEMAIVSAAARSRAGGAQVHRSR